MLVLIEIQYEKSKYCPIVLATIAKSDPDTPDN